MKKWICLIAGITLVLLSVSFWGCGRENSAELRDDTTELETEGNVDGLKLKELSDGIYALDLEQVISEISDYLVKDNYLYVSGKINEKTGVYIFDIASGLQVWEYLCNEGDLIEYMGDVYCSAYDGEPFKIIDWKSKPEKISEPAFLYEDEEELNGDPLAYGIRKLTEGQSIIASNQNYYASILYDAKAQKYQYGIYNREKELIFYGDLAPSEIAEPIRFSLTEHQFFVAYQDWENNQVHFVVQELQDQSVIEEPNLSRFEKGITLLTGEDAMQFNEENHVITAMAQVESNENVIAIATEQWNHVIASFPEGFFEEMLSGEKCARQSMVVMFFGDMPSNGDVSDEGGEASVDETTYYIGISITGLTEDSSVEGLMYHELMHVIDEYLKSIGESYEGWEGMLPEAFEYNGLYEGDNGCQNDYANTAFYEEDAEKVWFVDSYQKKNKAEDVAVLFQFACDTPNLFQGFPHMIERREYLSQVFRRNFTSVANCEDVLWE